MWKTLRNHMVSLKAWIVGQKILTNIVK